MPQPYELKNLFEQGQYDQVIAYWENPNELVQFSEWDFKVVMDSFYKLKRYPDCLEAYRKCYVKFPEFRMLDDKMGWAIYQTMVKNFNFQQGDVSTLLKSIAYALEHSSNTQYSARWYLVKFVAKAVKDGKLGGEQNLRLALQYLDCINPGILSTEEQRTIDEKGTMQRSASDQERWYSYKTKLLLRAQDYDACMACCDQALQAISCFHSNNDSWFRYYKAKCLRSLNRTEEAKAYVVEILQRGFSHWCLQRMMFEFEAEAGNDEKALAYAGACALSDPEHKMRVGFYEELANYLEHREEMEIPMLLRQLVLDLREENAWEEKNRHKEWIISEEIAAMDKQTILKRLVPVWREWRDKDKVFQTGTIDRLLAEGKSGFIVADDGNSYYFNARDLQGKNRTPQRGMKVKFTLIDKLDKSKGVVKKNAVEITML